MVKSQRQTMDDSVVSTSSSSVVFSQEAEEIARRRAFAHYDCQSLTTNLNYSVRLRRNHLAKRRNTTTGASAASMLIRSSTPDGKQNNYVRLYILKNVLSSNIFMRFDNADILAIIHRYLIIYLLRNYNNLRYVNTVNGNT